MLGWVMFLGLLAIMAALLLAGGQAVVADHATPANARLAGEVFTIPLAAAVRL